MGLAGSRAEAGGAHGVLRAARTQIREPRGGLGYRRVWATTKQGREKGEGRKGRKGRREKREKGRPREQPVLLPHLLQPGITVGHSDSAALNPFLLSLYFQGFTPFIFLQNCPYSALL